MHHFCARDDRVQFEHVISYWMLYQKLHSPASAGFAIGVAQPQSIITRRPLWGGLFTVDHIIFTQAASC
jgi:hypothetical protein